MSLVANYGSSDSESSDVESSTPTPSIAKSTSKSALGSLLPPPKSANKSNTSKPVIYVDLPKGGQSDDEEEQQAKRAKRQKVNTSGASDLASLLPAPKRGGYTFSRNKPTTTTATSKPSIADTLEQSLTARGENSSNAKKAEPIAEKKQVEAPLEPEDEQQQEPESMQGQEQEEEEDVPLDHSGPFFRLGKLKLSFTTWEEKEMLLNHAIQRG